MSLVFWGLLLLAVVFSGAFIYRLSANVRRFNRDREQEFSAEYDVSTHDAEFDLFLFRWASVFMTLATAWGLGEGLFKLLS